jgi:hypothetical protein
MASDDVLADIPLERLGAPAWAIEVERRGCARAAALEVRIGALEQATVQEAGRHGARAGRRWGAFLGALGTIISVSTQFPSCQNHQAAPSVDNRSVPK